MNGVRTKIILIMMFLMTGSMSLSLTSSWGVELYMPSLTLEPGQSVDIPVMIDQVENLAGVKLVMKYDAKYLEFKKAEKTRQTSSLMHIVNDKKPGILVVVMAGARGISGKDFSILSLRFNVKKEIKSQKNISMKFTDVQLMSDQLKDIDCDIKTSLVKVVPESGEESEKKVVKETSESRDKAHNSDSEKNAASDDMKESQPKKKADSKCTMNSLFNKEM